MQNLSELYQTSSTEVVCPDDTNPMHILKGGRVLQWMDNTAAICAQTFAGAICVTAGIQDMRFLSPARIGDMVSVKATVTRIFKTSMTIRVAAQARKVGEAFERLIAEGVFTFVSIDSEGKPIPLKRTTGDERENAA